VETEIFGTREVAAERSGIELAVGVELRDTDREPHA